MSVGLVFVWSDRPDGLQGELVDGIEAGRSCPRVLPPQLDPLTLPQRERRDHLAGDPARERILDVVVACSGDPALVQLVGGADVKPQPGRSRSREILSKRIQLAPQRPLAIQRQSRRSEEHTSELQSQSNLVCRLLLEKKKTHM